MEENRAAIKKYFSGLGWRFLLGTLVIYGIQLALAFLIRSRHPEWLENGSGSLLLTMASMYLIGMPFLIWMLRKLPGDAPARHSMTAGQFAVAAIMCYAILYTCNFIGMVLTFQITMLRQGVVENPLTDLVLSTNTFLIFFFMVICAPVYEEYIFRKLLVDKTLRYGQGTAILLSGLMFGLFHGNLNQFVYAFGIGVFFAFLYVKTGNLKITIGLHMLINFLGGVGMLFLKRMHLDEIDRRIDAGDIQVFGDSIGFIMLLLGYACVLFCVAVAGLVLLILYRKRFRLAAGRGDIPANRVFSTVFLNAGMILFVLFWVGMIAYRLFWG